MKCCGQIGASSSDAIQLESETPDKVRGQSLRAMGVLCSDEAIEPERLLQTKNRRISMDSQQDTLGLTTQKLLLKIKVY